VELLPSGKVLRVRGLQTGGKGVERADAGQRTAVISRGIEHTAIQRGMVLSRADACAPLAARMSGWSFCPALRR